MTEFPQLDSSLVVPVFNLGDDSVACLNKAMVFMSAVAALRFPSTNNQLRTSSNSRNQDTIQDGRVTVQQVQRRQVQSYAGEGHMARQCTQPKRPMNVTWFKKKAMLAEPQESGQILDEEQLTFLADLGIRIVMMFNQQSFTMLLFKLMIWMPMISTVMISLLLKRF
ncbi:hypothetical protein Tco_0322913 [Tanacetum coccineum]